MLRITIEEADNGYLVINRSTVEAEGGGNVDEETSYVFEGYDRDGLTKLLTHIAESYGESYDPFSRDNVRITWDRKGDEIE